MVKIPKWIEAAEPELRELIEQYRRSIGWEFMDAILKLEAEVEAAEDEQVPEGWYVTVMHSEHSDVAFCEAATPGADAGYAVNHPNINPDLRWETWQEAVGVAEDAEGGSLQWATDAQKAAFNRGVH